MDEINSAFFKLLFDISEEINKEELHALIFLCGKHVTAQDRENITDSKKLFKCLQKKSIISEDNLSFLKELLFIICRKDILRDKMKMKKEDIEKIIGSTQISQYRILLYTISQELSDKQIDDFKYVWNESKAKLENTSILDVFTEMEKSDKLSSDDLGNLKDCLEIIGRRDLYKKIENYEETANGNIKAITQYQKAVKINLYRLDKYPHGWCVIINNYNFSEAKPRKYTDRKGTEKDAERIRQLFDARGYITREHNDQTAKEIEETLKSYSQLDHTDKDSFVCFILSHGDARTVCGIDGVQIEIKRLKKLLNGLNCQSLINKPKLFFIQACQGKESQPAVTDTEYTDNVYENDAEGSHVPLEADFLTAFATVEDHTSLRHINQGSIYIQELCNAIDFKNRELTDILTSVNNKVAEKLFIINGKKVTQMPSFKSELRKSLILPLPKQTMQSFT
ncbi:hypothetical protein GDO86_017074 [Hymenochirus boettgeri]|uniref:Caspase-8 n=1 Tax=Hymenochirus boettgeri TaxID=247094 RepID=A0A8T2IIX2_9PIPI|nr:hypothetical protein GDO86_017074 [Hymenochirus boettgeri]